MRGMAAAACRMAGVVATGGEGEGRQTMSKHMAKKYQRRRERNKRITRWRRNHPRRRMVFISTLITYGVLQLLRRRW